ncbi:MAG TPA: L,D-transpeptidase family protein [Sphingomicrobium sp.]|nr:L,D-transpeptidase family protein [Sphingomicrobium sp.]
MLLAGALAGGSLALPTEAAASQPFYGEQERSTRPQWLAYGDERAAIRLISLLQSSDLDGLDPDQFNVGGLKAALRDAASGHPAALARAEATLDRALIDYAAALRSRPSPGWLINDREAVPAAPPAERLLAEAAAAPSLDRWLDAMPFMHHSYGELRRALARAEDRGDRRAEELLRVNLGRARMLPASGRFVMVNSAAQRLYMYEDGRVVDEMRVVVGRPAQPTPVMAAMIRFTALNPYWNVPPDLAAERIAPHVVKDGLSYLRDKGYVVLSDWSDTAQPVDPATIDWEAVAAGQVQLRVRQEPGPSNAMGRMKFMFPNPQGVYLHDTPDKELLNEEARLFSGGCVRLEDAARLATWLYGKPLSARGAGPEQPVSLDRPVPVYLAYLTADASRGDVVFFDDIYGKDRAQLAAQERSQFAAR